MEKQQRAGWRCRYRLSKYREDIAAYRGREADFHRRFAPCEVSEGEGNCLLNTGIDEMWSLVCGGSADHYGAASATIGVGDDDTAADAAQTDLQASANKTYQAMDSGYPSLESQQATFRASFGDDEANYAWNEWVVKNSSSGICLNRKVESLGTKSGGTWTLEVSITLS